MPQATYIRGTKFDSFWFEIKEYLLNEVRVWAVLSLEHDPKEVVTREELMMNVSSFLVGKETVTVSELSGLANKLKNEYDSIDPSFLMVMIDENKMTLVGCGAEAYLIRGDKRGYLLKKSNDCIVKGGLMAEGDLLFVGVGDGFAEVIENMGGQKSIRKIEEDLLKPCGGIMFEFVEEESEESMEEKINLKPESKGEILDKKNRNSGVWKKWREYIGKKRKTANPEVYVKSEERRKLGVVVLVVFLLLIISVGLGWRKRRIDEKEKAFAEIYEPTLQMLIDAERLATDNPLEAREKLLQAQVSIEQVLGSFEGKEKEKEKLVSLQTQVDELYEKISGEKEIEEASLFYDLSLVKEDVYGSSMSLADGWITVLDESRGVVIGVEVETKQAKILAGGEVMSGSKLLAASGGKATVLSNSGLVGVFYGDRVAEVLQEKDESWRNPVGLGMFGGNVYVIDDETSEIWRYPGYDGGLGSGSRWLGPGVVPNFSDTVGVTVDGDIWIASSDGRIQRFRRGAPMNFSINGLVDGFEKVGGIYAEAERENVYVLDVGAGRVVTASKEGEYKNQYVWEGMKTASDMVVVENDDGQGIILLLSGSQIYEIPLEQ